MSALAQFAYALSPRSSASFCGLRLRRCYRAWALFFVQQLLFLQNQFIFLHGKQIFLQNIKPFYRFLGLFCQKSRFTLFKKVLVYILNEKIRLLQEEFFMKRLFVGVSAVLLAASVFANGAQDKKSASSAEWKPAKDVNVVVAYKAGSGTDTGARILCSIAEKYVGKTLVIQNKPGADGKIGYTSLVTSKPDGYTIGFINLPTFNSLAAEKGSVFSKDSVVPIVNHLFEPSVVVVKKDAPWNTIEEFIEYCKANPGKVLCSTNGVKASNHIGIQLLAKAAGFKVNCIPYGGTADQLLALRQGEVQVSVPKAGDVASLIGENGELKVLASYTDERLEDMPNVPTLKEKGYKLVYGSARALVAPAGTPQEIIDFYVKAFTETMKDAENIEKSKNAGLSLSYMSPEVLGQFIDSEDDFVRNTLPTLFD